MCFAPWGKTKKTMEKRVMMKAKKKVKYMYTWKANVLICFDSDNRHY